MSIGAPKYWVIKARVKDLYMHEGTFPCGEGIMWRPERKGARRFESKQSAFAFLASGRLVFEAGRKPKVIAVGAKTLITDLQRRLRSCKDPAATRRMRARIRYHESLAAGRCVASGCEDPHAPGKSRCTFHMERARDMAANQRARLEQ